MDIKAIDTVYNGYRFRSRLEARWAVFFDAIGAEYEYEAQGYEFPSGKYLPDFWLPKERGFIEIKPGNKPENFADKDAPREVLLCFELMRATRLPVYMFYGDPVACLAPEYPGMVICTPGTDDDDSGLSFLYLGDTDIAAVKARQARFEHGQSGMS